MSASNENQESDSRTSADTDDQSSVGKTASGSNTSRNGDGATPMPAEKFGGGNASLSATGKDAAKRKKPKNNIAKNNSSFVSRIISHENIVKRLADRNSEDLFVFANINRAFNWLDMDSANKVRFFTTPKRLRVWGLIFFVPCSKNLYRKYSLPRRIHFATMSIYSREVLVTWT